MVYTSYFGKWRKINGWVFPVSIVRYKPEWFGGPNYSKLAPPSDLLMEWKNDPCNDDYFGIKRRQYNEAVLDKLDVHQVAKELEEMLPYKLHEKLKGKSVFESQRAHIVLLCFEKPCDFCHRHFVAQWLTKNGYKCEEAYL